MITTTRGNVERVGIEFTNAGGNDAWVESAGWLSDAEGYTITAGEQVGDGSTVQTMHLFAEELSALRRLLDELGIGPLED